VQCAGIAAVTPFLAKLAWWAGVVGWYVIRYPHARRARRTPIAEKRERVRDLTLLSISFCGLFVVPVIYVTTGQPKLADYPFNPLPAWLGVVVFALSLALFYRTHRDLGRFWSVTLEIRKSHQLVTSGVYNYVRHPMYAAFFLWALARPFCCRTGSPGPPASPALAPCSAFGLGARSR
jgi:protein-S-isoprenylcysteine O-methyltransferase Ste14